MFIIEKPLTLQMPHTVQQLSTFFTLQAYGMVVSCSFREQQEHR